MNKLRTARLLMVATILLVVAFQVYWLNRLYREEKSNMEQSADIVFRETLYRLQAQRFTGDTMVFRSMPGDNLFMTDVISTVRKDFKTGVDSPGRKIIVSLNTGVMRPGDSMVRRKLVRDTVHFSKRRIGIEPPEHITRFLDSNRILNDSIPLHRIDSLYQNLLAKEGIAVPYVITKTTGPDPAPKTGVFLTRKIPVGFLNPTFYQAAFSDLTFYAWKKISMQLVLSLLLVLLTLLSFIFIYRNLLAQKKLTALKNEFINNVTHELKTPIATVNVAIEALRDFGGLNSPEKTREYLDISAIELQRLSMLVDKVLKLSMFENQAISLQKESFDLLVVTEQVITSMKLQFEREGVKTTLQTSGSNFNIVADQLHLTSVIYNLLDNAFKYGRKDPQIDVHLLDQTTYLELRVADNGIGIAPEYTSKIFEQFFRVPSGDTHNIKGYGLGLSYVNHIVRRHQGFIEVESELGKGSTFIVKLPFAEASVIEYDKGRRVQKIAFKL